MPLQLSRQGLIDAVNVVKSGISKTPISEQLTHVFFLNNHVGCFSGERFIVREFPTGLTFSVPVAAILPVLERMDGEVVHVSFDGNTVKLTSRRSRSGLTINLDVSVMDPVLQQVNSSGVFQMLPPIFFQGLEFCKFSASEDITQGILSCICTREGVMYSSDDLRITRYNLISGNDSVDFQLNIQVFDAEILLKNKPLGVRSNGNWTIFSTDPQNGPLTIIGITPFDGEFPNVDDFFTMEGAEISFPESLPTVVAEVSHFCDGMFTVDKKLKLQITNEKVICRAENQRTWFEKEIAHAQPLDREINIVINPLFFEQILQKTKSAVVGEDRVFFTSDDFEHVLALPGV